MKEAQIPRSAAILAIVLLLAGAGAVRAEVTATPGGIRFTYQDANAGKVQLAGSFNDWTGADMDAEGGGLWSKVVRLGPGIHEYKFVVDGQWIADPTNPVTVGDYGNSAFTLGEDGRMASMESTANTPYSARILVTGRSIALYQSFRNPETGDRFELRRPDFDTDLVFGVRVNDVMDARIVTNIHNASESESIELYRTRLNFDRGQLHFDTGELEGWAWDNDSVGTWEDPLHLVGDVGIYHHSYGYDTQGAMLRKDLGPVNVRVLYSDDFRLPSGGEAVMTGVGTPSALVPGAFNYSFVSASDDKDVLAARGTWEEGDLAIGVSARSDRGYNSGSLQVLSSFRPDSVEFVFEDPSGTAPPETLTAVGNSGLLRGFSDTDEQWRAFGADARWTDAAGPVDVVVEVLYGKARIAARQGLAGDVFGGTAITAAGDTLDVALSLTEPEQTDSDRFDLDDSWRIHLGFDGLPPVLGIEASTSLEMERHEQTAMASDVEGGVTNEAWIWRLEADRPFRVSGRDVESSLGLEFTRFDYDPATPWESQLWFDLRNFWLENGEHDVSYERLTLLGGLDALVLRPSLTAEIWPERGVSLEYDGTIAGPGFGKEPSYVETILRGIWKFRPRWRFTSDLRFAKYNHRPLDLSDSYNETFLEVAYKVTEGIELALSYGVDPWAIDDKVNEYGYIGRDLYLFDRGANGATARTDYLDLAERIPAAESALADERVLQLEAVVRF